MNKSDLTEILAKEWDLNLPKAQDITKKFCETMAEALESGHRIEIRGFGSFTVRDYEGYTGRNPKTGEIIPVAGKKPPFFKVGKDWAGAVNQESHGG